MFCIRPNSVIFNYRCEVFRSDLRHRIKGQLHSIAERNQTKISIVFLLNSLEQSISTGTPLNQSSCILWPRKYIRNSYKSTPIPFKIRSENHKSIWIHYKCGCFSFCNVTKNKRIETKATPKKINFHWLRNDRAENWLKAEVTSEAIDKRRQEKITTALDGKGFLFGWTMIGSIS